MFVKVYLITSILVFLFAQYFEMLIAMRDAARNELSALKAQINPHFLFNNLNTIYSMASNNDERTADVVMKLSDFLRYVLYDAMPPVKQFHLKRKSSLSELMSGYRKKE